jgi:hypothetical protein
MAFPCSAFSVRISPEPSQRDRAYFLLLLRILNAGRAQVEKYGGPRISDHRLE